MTVRAPFGNALRVLATLVVLTAAVSAQVPDHATVQQLGPDSNWTGTEPVAPHDLRWDERLPESRPEPTAGDIRGDLPRSRMADLADLEGIFSYRFVGEHFSSFAGNSISFSDDTDCDGFSEVLIGSPLFGGQGFSGGPGAAYVVSVADVEAADAADGIVDRVVDLGFVAALPRSWKLVGAGRQGVGTAVASDGDANGDGCSDLLIGAPDRYSTGSAYVVFRARPARGGRGGRGGGRRRRYPADCGPTRFLGDRRWGPGRQCRYTSGLRSRHERRRPFGSADRRAGVQRPEPARGPRTCSPERPWRRRTQRMASPTAGSR